MTNLGCLENPKLSLLQQLFSSATHDASAAMCRWTNSVISLTLDEVCEIPLEDVCGVLDLGDELLTMVVLNLEGDIGGDMVLTFSAKSARRLVACLLQTDVPSGPGWSELEQSALMETGNILGCAYVNAITRLIDHQLIPSTPQFVVDFGPSVVQQVVLTHAASTNTVLICRTRFQHEDEQLEWWLLFIPSVALREVMERALS